MLTVHETEKLKFLQQREKTLAEMVDDSRDFVESAEARKADLQAQVAERKRILGLYLDRLNNFDRETANRARKLQMQIGSLTKIRQQLGGLRHKDGLKVRRAKLAKQIRDMERELRSGS